MKLQTIASIILAVFMLSGCGTVMGVKAPPEASSMEKIIDIAKADKDELYIKANTWFVDTFVSAESVIEFQDKEAGKIAGKYTFEYSEGFQRYRVKQTIDLSIRDNMVRVEIRSPVFRVVHSASRSMPHTEYVPLETQAGLNKARTEWNMLINSLEEALRQSYEW